MEVRGRNGWFVFDKVTVDHFLAAIIPEDSTWVKVYSKKLGEYAPVIFKGDFDEVLNFLQGIVLNLRRKRAEALRGIKGFTEEQAERVRQGTCPWCGGHDFSYMEDNHDGSSVWLRYGCEECEGEWEEKYDLSGVMPRTGKDGEVISDEEMVVTAL